MQKHNMSYSPEFNVWRGMLKRCHLPTDKDYPNYGGRGIEVCERWKHSFVNFHQDMGDRPEPHLSVDRIDTNGNYEPSNCRWTTSTQQNRNRRNNHLVTFRGETKTISEWAEITGIQKSTIRRRLVI